MRPSWGRLEELMMTMRWRAAVLPVLVVVLLASMASADPALYIDPALTEVWTGEDFWVEISVNEELLGLTGYDLIIDYDESVLEVLQVIGGALPQSSGASFFYWTTGPAPENAIVINSAIGGSTNAPIHLNGIARHLGVPLDNDDWQKLGHHIPLLVNHFLKRFGGDRGFTVSDRASAGAYCSTTLPGGVPGASFCRTHRVVRSSTRASPQSIT